MAQAKKAENECLKCGHEWKDRSGEWARCYASGCPSCGSRYWKWRNHGDRLL